MREALPRFDQPKQAARQRAEPRPRRTRGCPGRGWGGDCADTRRQKGENAPIAISDTPIAHSVQRDKNWAIALADAGGSALEGVSASTIAVTEMPCPTPQTAYSRRPPPLAKTTRQQRRGVGPEIACKPPLTEPPTIAVPSAGRRAARGARRHSQRAQALQHVRPRWMAGRGPRAAGCCAAPRRAPSPATRSTSERERAAARRIWSGARSSISTATQSVRPRACIPWLRSRSHHSRPGFRGSHRSTGAACAPPFARFALTILAAPRAGTRVVLVTALAARRRLRVVGARPAVAASRAGASRDAHAPSPRRSPA